MSNYISNYRFSTFFFIFHLDIPICAMHRDELIGALKNEVVSLKCDVDASPPADSYHWTFNSSGEQTELQQAKIHSSEVRDFGICYFVCMCVCAIIFQLF